MSDKQPLLQIRELSIQFGGLKAVDGLSFEIHENEIFGLIGPNGAGKTTVFNCITQFYKADKGELRFVDKNGQSINLSDLPVHKVLERGIVRTFQNVELIKELSVIDNVLIGAHIDFHCGVLAELFDTPRRRKEEATLRAAALEALTFLGIAHLAALPAGSQPYGVQKKVELARTLMAKPRLIILDEPAAGLHEKETEQLADEIRRIRERYQCAILLVEHDMRLVMQICDRICAISFGRHLATGKPAEIQENALVQEAYLGVET